MLTCPRCKKKGISAWDKIWSGSYTVAKCNCCGHSYCIKQEVKRAFCTLRYLAGLFVFFAAVLFNPIISLASYALFLGILEILLIVMAGLKEVPEIHSQSQQ